MNEVTIAQQLSAQLNDDSLVIQVAFAAPYIQVVINRTQLPPDYPALSNQIARLLGRMDLPDIQYVAVYGRVYGQEELEYETSLEIIKTPVVTAPPPTHTIPSDNPFLTAASPPAEPEVKVFNLANYCFTRNKALLTSALPSPKMPIAELIRDFDQFADSEKQLILEQLGTFLRNPDGVNTQDWSENMRAWLGRIRKLSDEETRSFAIWISRYCAHSEKTLETVRDVFKAAKEAEKERLRQEREARLAERAVTQNTSTSKPKTVSPEAQRFSGDELVLMIIGSLLIAFIGWFLWGIVAPFSFIGWGIAIVSILTGILWATENQTAKLVGSFISILLTVLAFAMGLLGFVVLLVDFLGSVMGIITGVMVFSTMKTSGASSVFAPKPFRLLCVLSLVMILGWVYSIVDPPGEAVSFETKNLFQNKEINGFSSATCEQLVQRVENERFTVQDAIDVIGVGASDIQAEVRAGRGGYIWDYDNAKIVLLVDEVSNKAVVDAVATCMVCEKSGSLTKCAGLNTLSDFP